MKTLKILLAAAALVYLAIGLRPVFWPKGGEEPEKMENKKPAAAAPAGGGEEQRLNVLGQPHQGAEGSMWVSAAALSPDGKQLLMGYHIVSASLRGIDLATVKWLTLWDVETGKEIKGLYGHNRQMVYAAFLPDGKRAVSADREGTVIVWDLDKRGKPFSFSTGDKNLSYAALAVDGAGLYTYGENFKLWDIKSGKLLRNLEGPKMFSIGLQLSRDGNYGVFSMIRGTDFGQIAIWDMDEDRKIDSFKLSRSSGDSCAFTRDGKAVIISKLEGYLALYDLATFKEIRRFEERPWEPMHAIWVSPDGKSVFSYPSQGAFRRWDTASGKVVWEVKGRGISVGSLAYSNNGKIAVTALDREEYNPGFGWHEVEIKIWDLETGKVLRTLPSPWLP